MCALRFCLQGPMGPCLSFSHCCVLGRIDVATNKAHGKGPVPYTLHASPEKRCHTQSLNKGYETRCVLKFCSNLQTQKQLFGFFFCIGPSQKCGGRAAKGNPGAVTSLGRTVMWVQLPLRATAALHLAVAGTLPTQWVQRAEH